MPSGRKAPQGAGPWFPFFPATEHCGWFAMAGTRPAVSRGKSAHNGPRHRRRSANLPTSPLLDLKKRRAETTCDVSSTSRRGDKPGHPARRRSARGSPVYPPACSGWSVNRTSRTRKRIPAPCQPVAVRPPFSKSDCFSHCNFGEKKHLSQEAKTYKQIGVLRKACDASFAPGSPVSIWRAVP